METSKVLALVRELVSSSLDEEERGQGERAQSKLGVDVIRGAAEEAQVVVNKGEETKLLWHNLAEEGIKPAKVASSYARVLSGNVLSRECRLSLAHLYSALLAMKDAPALGLFDEIAWSCTIANVRTCFAGDKTCVAILKNLSRAVSERLNLNSFESSVTTTIETLTPLSREIKSVADEEEGNNDNVNMMKISDLWRESLDALYDFLECIVKPVHGFRRSTTVALMRSIQPVLLLNVSNRKAPAKVKSFLRKRALDFLKKFARSSDEDEENLASKSVGALARHCCIKAPDSAEARDCASISVSKLVSFLPADQAREFTSFLAKMCRHPQTNQRVFAIEVVHHLMEECSVDSGRETEEFQGSHLSWKVLIEGIISRALDKISFIRVKAINCLASMLFFVNKNGYENPIGKAMEATVCSETSMDSPLKQKIVILAINRSRDSKPTVRKAALSLLEQSLLLCDGIDSKSMNAITSASHDTFVSVRKQSATTVSSLFNAFSGEENVCRMWLQVILPLCLDTEVSIQTACKECFQREFLDSLSRGKCQEFVSFIASESNFALLLRKVMGVTKLTHSQLARVAKTLQNEIKALNNPAAETGFWIILSEVVAKYPSLLDSGFIHGSLKNLDAYLSEGKTLARVMQTISNSAKKMNHEFSLEASNVLTDKLKTFSVPIEAISYCLAALHEVSKVLYSSSTSSPLNHLSEVATCAEQLFKDCMARKNLAGSESNLACALYTMGDLSLLKSFQISSGVISLVQSMTTDRLLGLDVKIPPTVQAHSWACLGKFCLKNEDLAKRMIPLFFHEIKKTSISAVRNNIMLILADLCTKYTSLVDVHIGEIAECFDDPSEVVRRQTLIVLATLLQQDFLKWRGPIFHCFLLSLVDDSKNVQSLGSFLLSTSLSQKASQLAYNFFVQTLFALNGHSSHTNLAMTMEAESLIRTNIKDLAGSDSTNRQKRCIIYHHLLKRMSPEHKFQIAAKICEDCISPLVDRNLDFDSHNEVLRDSLVVLASKEMKVHLSAHSGEMEEDQNLAFAAAKGKVISAMMKKHLVDTIVPLVIELKRMLESQKSPLLGILLNFACAVLKEYKEEIEEILVADNTFAKEVLYEIQQENKSRQPLLCDSESVPNSPILRGNSFATPIAPQTVSRSPLPVGTTSKTPLAAEVLQDEGMMTAKSVKKNSEKKYLESARLLHPVGENTTARNAQLPASKEKKDKNEEFQSDKNNNDSEVRRLSSLFNAAAD